MKKSKAKLLVRRLPANEAYLLREKTRGHLFKIGYKFYKDYPATCDVSAPPAFWEKYAKVVPAVQRALSLEQRQRVDIMARHPVPEGYEYFDRNLLVGVGMKYKTGLLKKWQNVPKRMIGEQACSFVHSLFARPIALWRGIMHASMENAQPLCDEYAVGDRIAKVPGEKITCKFCLEILHNQNAKEEGYTEHPWRTMTRTEAAEVLRAATVGGVEFPGCNVFRLGFVSKNSVAFKMEIESVREADSYQSMVFRIRNIEG